MEACCSPCFGQIKRKYASQNTKQTKPLVQLHNTASPFSIFQDSLYKDTVLWTVLPGMSSLGISPVLFLTHKLDFILQTNNKNAFFSLFRNYIKYYISLP